MKSLTEFPEYVAASEKLAEVQAALRDTATRITALTLELTNRQAPTVASRAEAWLNGGNVPEPVSTPGVREQLVKLYDQRAMLTEAVKIQEKRLSDIRYTCSKEIMAERLPTYTKIVERLAELVFELGQVNEQEAKFREALTLEDVVASPWMAAVPFHPIGILSDEFSAARLYLREIFEFFPDVAARLPKEITHVVKGK